MRYRIRVIALVLICSLLAVILWIAKSFWFPVLPVEDISVVSVSPLQPDPWSNPTPSSSAESLFLPEESIPPPQDSPSPEPLFDTYGL